MTQTRGAATGGVRLLLRAEGVLVLSVCVVLYAGTGHSWWYFAALLLAPDLALLGYLAGPRVGAVAYNTVHAYVGPLALAIASRGDGVAYAVALIWAAHCGMDRALGYGLKYATAFGDTHLGQVGRARPVSRAD